MQPIQPNSIKLRLRTKIRQLDSNGRDRFRSVDKVGYDTQTHEDIS